MMSTTLRLCGWLLLLLPVSLSADTLYRSVDPEGRVIYSDTPQSDSVETQRIQVESKPSAAAQQQAQQRESEIRRAADKAVAQREYKRKQRARVVEQAEQQLQEAEQRLEQARVLRDEDRQTIGGGKGRRIRPEYFERIEQAEAAVAAARKRLQQARIGR
ncbi:DUF4124 domain-containing protein [Candidatus Endoriftia persephone]|uniref:DUF4124 domain-containing protein n=3 Tax=Gammaproteobacteria TaxID=1236 RepID=G2FH27_9GAMM|nr:DUF4124 domain-containing protein [Candidatus Endoriftia persephone]EGW53841.1 hypothetical protein TevJSym_at00100 [endosymbiont of Tevnia jerichonana (vent Tica)]USF87692.1 DUF4124 domain-containing protein [Candidatus Endoriftia persephone]